MFPRSWRGPFFPRLGLLVGSAPTFRCTSERAALELRALLVDALDLEPWRPRGARDLGTEKCGDVDLAKFMRQLQGSGTWVRATGVDKVQGDFLSKPESLDEVVHVARSSAPPAPRRAAS